MGSLTDKETRQREQVAQTVRDELDQMRVLDTQRLRPQACFRALPVSLQLCALQVTLTSQPDFHHLSSTDNNNLGLTEMVSYL